MGKKEKADEKFPFPVVFRQKTVKERRDLIVSGF